MITLERIHERMFSSAVRWLVCTLLQYCGLSAPYCSLWLVCTVCSTVACLHLTAVCGLSAPFAVLWLVCTLLQSVACLHPLQYCGLYAPYCSLWLVCIIGLNKMHSQMTRWCSWLKAGSSEILKQNLLQKLLEYALSHFIWYTPLLQYALRHFNLNMPLLEYSLSYLNRNMQ
jgi:hypothetical protein